MLWFISHTGKQSVSLQAFLWECKSFVKSFFGLNSGLGLKLSNGKLLIRSHLLSPVSSAGEVGGCGISSDGGKARMKKWKVYFLLKHLLHFDYKEESKPMMEET